METTHGTSGKRPWWRGSSQRSILPPAGCREEVCWRSRSWKHGDGGTEERSRKRVLSFEVSRHGEYIGEGVIHAGHQGSRRPPSAAPPWGAPGGLLGPWWWPSGPTLVIPEASVALIFYLIFPNFWSIFNMGETRNRKT